MDKIKEDVHASLLVLELPLKHMISILCGSFQHILWKKLARYVIETVQPKCEYFLIERI